MFLPGWYYSIFASYAPSFGDIVARWHGLWVRLRRQNSHRKLRARSKIDNFDDAITLQRQEGWTLVLSCMQPTGVTSFRRGKNLWVTHVTFLTREASKNAADVVKIVRHTCNPFSARAPSFWRDFFSAGMKILPAHQHFSLSFRLLLGGSNPHGRGCGCWVPHVKWLSGCRFNDARFNQSDICKIVHGDEIFDVLPFMHKYT